MKKIKVAVAGYGQIGPVHMRSYRKIADKVEVVAVADLREERRELVRNEYGIAHVCTDYRELFALDEPDCIDVCIPTYEHAALVLEAARHGKHVFCEKPMAMRMEDAEAMERMCRDAGVSLQLGFVRRFDNEWLKFKEIVTGGLLGRPVVWRTAAAGQGAPNPWFFQRDLGGGPFMDGAIHNYDFGNFMFGKAKCATARGLKLQSGRTAPDTGVAVVEYESGDMLQVMWSWGMKPGCRSEGIHDVLGERGILQFKAAGKDPLKAADASLGSLVISRPGGEEEIHEYRRNDMFADEMEHFADSVIGGTQPRVGARQGKEALRVALAVLKSFETGRTVMI